MVLARVRNDAETKADDAAARCPVPSKLAAANRDVDTVFAHIAPHAVPKIARLRAWTGRQVERRNGRVRETADPRAVGASLKYRTYSRAIKSAVFFSDILPKQAISADDRRSAGDPLPSRSVNDHQVIAYSVEMVLVATRQPGRKDADGSAVSKRKSRNEASAGVLCPACGVQG